MKKNQAKKSARARARNERRRIQQKARKAARNRGPAQASASRGMTHVMIDLAGRGHYDDCPICRAMAKPNATDEEVLAAFDECEGHRLEDVQRWFETITAVLEAEGARTDIENMDDDQLRAHFDRVSQINAELRSQMTN